MEFYGSIASVSGSITASLFTGSFKGDGGSLYNLPASGVTGLNLSQIASGNATASISSTGFTVNKSTQIQGDLSVTGSIIATNYIVSSSVTYMTTSFASGSSMFGNDGNDVHQFTGSVQITGSITLNGQAIGTGKLDETTFQSYTSSISSSIGSLSSSIALTDVSQSNRLTTIEGNYATTGSNLFKGSQTISGSIIPSVDNTYDLGSVTHQWRDVYISSGSLYIDGTKVLGSTSQELTITTDTGQSIKILEAGSDSIILQSADGDIELKSSGGGDILFDPTNGIISIKGTTQIQDGFKITSSGGNSIVFGDTVIVSGSIDLTGNVDGIDLQSFSSSVSTSISSLLGGNTSLSSSIATTTSGLSSSIGSLSSSVATTTSGLTSTITSVSSSLTSSIGSLSSSLATTTSGLSSSIGSLSSSVATTTSGLSSSIATTTYGLSSSIGSLSSSVATTTSGLSSSIGSISSSINSTIGLLSSSVSTSIGSLSSSVATTTSGLSSSIEFLSSSIATTTISAKNRVDSIETTTGSLNTFSSSINTTIKSKLDIESVISGSVQVVITGTTGYSTFSSSVSTSIGALSSSVATTTSGLTSTITSLSSSLTSSIGGLSSSIATTTSGLSSSIGSLSSSIATTTSGLSSSIATTTLGTKNRVDSIEAKTGSYATTGSNIFQGNQTITGSLYISQDLIVAGSSSIQNISSSILNIGDNIITVNALNPSVRFGGLAVIDSGSSPQVSGSMLFDSVNDQWIFVHQNQSSVTSSILLMGPQTFNSLGSESYPTTNRILKSVNAEHLGDSNISDNGTKVSINSNTEITGSLIVTGDKITVNAVGGDEGGEILLGKAVTNTTLSGSGVTIDVWQNRLRFFEQGGNARGAFLDISTLANGVGTNLLGTASTASYVEYSNVANKPSLVSGSSQISYTGLSNIPSGIVSSSAQTIANLPSGTVSGSAQVLNGTTIHSGSFFNGISVVSGSAQISFNGITDKPTLVSGSSQITYGSISSIPSGIVSGSGQIDLTATTNYASGILTRLNAVGVFSGSAQIDLTATTNYASGILTRLNAVGVFSGSAQVTGIGNAQLTNSSFNIGTTSISLGRASASQTLTGVSIDGNAATVSNGVYTNVSNTITGGRLIVGYSEASEPFVNGHFYNTNTTASQQYGGVLLSGINQAHLRFQVGTNTWDGAGAKKWQLRVGNGTGADEFGIYSWTKGSNTMTISSNGDTVVSGNISATNFSGTSSGTNTGDVTETLATVTGRGNTTTTSMAIGSNSIPNGKLYVNGGSVTDVIAIQNTLNTGAYLVFADNVTPTWANAPRLGAINNDMVFKILDVERFRIASTGATFTSTISASNFSGTHSGTSSGTNTGDQTNISGNAATASSVNFANIATGTRTNYNLDFKPTTDSYAGIRFSKSTSADGAGDAGYILIRGTSDADIYTAEGITMVADMGWLTLSQRTTAGKGVRIMTGTSSSVTRFSVAAAGDITVTANMAPSANNSYNLGSATYGWANVYTNDLHLSNMNKPEGNDIDKTNGNWTIQEGAENLYIINNNNGKKFKIDLTEII